MKTTKEIAADCGIWNEGEIGLLNRIQNNQVCPAGQFQEEVFHLISALYRRIETLEEAK